MLHAHSLKVFTCGVPGGEDAQPLVGGHAGSGGEDHEALAAAAWMTIAGVGTGLSLATTASAALGELTQERAGAGSGVLQALKNTGAPQALRLFRLQGYQATTAEQIAQPVEVSASTVFGYFPAKEALILTDEHDPVIIAAIRTQPPDADPARAVRGAPGVLSGMLSADELADMCQRTELALSVPGTPCRDAGPVRPGDAPDHRYRRGAPGGATTTSGPAPWPGNPPVMITA